MKKISAVALGLSLAGVAQASSSVSIYGLLDLSVGVSRTGSGTTLPSGRVAGAPSQSLRRVDSGLGAGSRLGFRGVEDLGAGLKANFVLEMGVGADTGNFNQGGLGFGRQSFVGLGGSNWSVSLGRQYTPMDLALATSEPMGGGYWGNVTNHAAGIYDNVGATPGDGTYQLMARADNSVLLTGSTDAWTAKLMLAAGNENPRGTGRMVNAALAYASGPVAATVSAARFRQPAGMITATASPEWISQWMAGGSYDFGVLKLYAGAFGQNGPDNESSRSAAATPGAVGASPFAYAWDRNRYLWLGARVPLGTGAVLAQYSRAKFSYREGGDGSSDIYGVTYEHPLSKRTLLYANYGGVRNNARANSFLVAAIPLVGPNGYGASPRAFSLGMRHTF